MYLALRKGRVLFVRSFFSNHDATIFAFTYLTHRYTPAAMYHVSRRGRVLL